MKKRALLVWLLLACVVLAACKETQISAADEAGKVDKIYYAGDTIYGLAQYPPDLAAFAALADYHLSIDGAPPVQASGKFIKYIEGLPYVSLSEFAELVGYELVLYEEGNLYIPTPWPEYTQIMNFYENSIPGGTRQDGEAQYVSIMSVGYAGDFLVIG